MTRKLRAAAIAGALAATVALPSLPAASADTPIASAAGACKVGDGRGLGPTYVTSLRVSGTSCATGKKVVRAYYQCRVRNGGKRGRCTSKVLGFRCSERRGSSIPTQFDAKVTCRKGGATVKHAYTQFT
ncbi:MAG TPA: hypothetical protein VFR97_12740 [Capillimicrobium sp.]|nr:hypothetical protein [Capillimicrobium sp.]